MANPVISPLAPQWGDFGAGVKTLTVAPFAVGDLAVLEYYASAGGPATGVSGGGVTTWACASSYNDTTNGNYASIWWGVVTAAGSATVTVTDAGLSGSDYSTLWVREFTAIGAVWSVVTQNPAAGSSGGTPATSGPAVTYPSLSPSAGGNDLYLGACWSYYGHMDNGSTTGFLYVNPASNTPLQAAYNWTVSAPAAPTSTADNNGTYLAIAVIFTAGGGTVTGPAYATSNDIISGGLGSWSNPSNAEGPPDGSFATWAAP